MAKITRTVTINGVKHWIRASTEQEYADKLLKLVGTQSAALEPVRHLFADYAMTWFETYSKPNIETVTATTYKRQLTCHLLPAFEGLAVEDITTDDVQRLFNGMTGAKTSKDKTKMVLNQILDAAVEDGLITKTPYGLSVSRSPARPASPQPPIRWSKCATWSSTLGTFNTPQTGPIWQSRPYTPSVWRKCWGCKGPTLTRRMEQSIFAGL